MSPVLEKRDLLKPWETFLPSLNVLKLCGKVSEESFVRLLKEVFGDIDLKKDWKDHSNTAREIVVEENIGGKILLSMIGEHVLEQVEVLETYHPISKLMEG